MYQLKTREERMDLRPRSSSCWQYRRESLLKPQENLQEPQVKKRYRSWEYPPGPDARALAGPYALWLTGPCALWLMEPESTRYGSRYLDLRSDFAFKHIFGKEANKELLIDFLNSLRQGRKAIGDLRYGLSERQGETKKNQESAVRYPVYQRPGRAIPD
ncbi:PD-(D/E)XK nuclease-like transposase [Anseongella ginsenosidimutans]|uniref:PD-(D/E)XK nuclease-like transposase n=1 Tax=Anseongella ginsenosidimutans TaxID=496056 RepID=A0A4R3KNC3_9SPHI|nr:PD-(D/E)XK nuclease family transposase [Anseongella ginsenosidimutans]QEC52736.1 hypothetical protein FRZ59_10575 [Anseongella ginsenosidimutans]TCS85492.1 PD-(D/E)XK nuclease-like transposase [Anseongella ginsenosidimutans]